MSNTKTKPSGGLIDLGLGVRVWRRINITATDEDWPFEVKIDARVENFRLSVTRLCFERCAGEEHGITSNSVRKVRVASLVRRGFRQATALASGGNVDPIMRGDPDHLSINDRARRGAVIYRLAVLEGGNPTEAVAEDLGVSRPTASRAIQRARELGALGASRKTRTGEEF